MIWQDTPMIFGRSAYDVRPHNPKIELPVNVTEEYNDGTCKGIIDEGRLSAAKRIILDYVL